MNKLNKYKYLVYKILCVSIVVCILVYLFNAQIYSSSYTNEWDLIILITLSTIMFILPKYVDVIVGCLFTEILAIYMVSQDIYYRAFSSYYRLATALSLANEVTGQTDSILELLKISDVISVLLPILVLIFLIFGYRKINGHNKVWYINVTVAIIAIVSISIIYNNFHHKLEDSTKGYDTFGIYKTDYYIYNDVPSSEQFVQKFGLASLLIKDINKLIFTISGHNNFDEIASYLDTMPTNSPNDYTGYFKDKNLVIIQAESLVNFAIDETITPTLYKMKNEGIYVDGFNAPLLIGSTSDTEHMANIGLIPMSEGYATCYKYVNNDYPTTLGNLFRTNGYTTLAFHNNFKEYYNRDIVFDKFGYDFYDSYGLGLESEDLDSKILEQIKWILMEKQKFLAYWVTYTGHQPYTGEFMKPLEDYKEWISSLYPSLDEKVIGYLAKTMDLDVALETFLIDLENNGKLEDTVIIIFGDHYAKGLTDDATTQNIIENMNFEGIDENYIHSTPLIIFDGSNSEGINYEMVSNTSDLLPTIANLWGFTIDYKTILGNDIFDQNYQGFYFNQAGDIKTNDFYYSNVTDSFEYYRPLDEIDARGIVQSKKQLLDISKKIFMSDYFQNIKNSN